MKASRLALFVCCAALLCAAFFYPKWEKGGREGTISYDVSGYYLYLPAAFIYKDLKKAAFRADISKKYDPWPGGGPGTELPNGHFVLQYSCGQALHLLPAFAIGHAWAKISGQAADGFSPPYQKAVSCWGLLTAFVGLFFLRKNLLNYFSENAVAASMLLIVLGSNYLNYAAIDNAMTHNWLFTLYNLLIFSTIRFYKTFSMKWAATIGLLVGWAALTRPTEIVAVALPVFWGAMSLAGLRGRLFFFQKNWRLVAVAVAAAAAVGSLQLFYWKAVTGQWLFYSYGNQEFTWLHPHIRDGLFSGRAGWLVYSPVMGLAVAGLFFLWKKGRGLFLPAVMFLFPFMYLTWAWDIWWYGGSLGQRAMVQSYPVWAFALAALADWAFLKRWKAVLLGLIAAPCIAFNLWLTYQAHGGGLFVSEQMTTPYLRRVLFSFETHPQALTLLDHDEFFDGERRDVLPLFAHDFEKDTLAVTRDGAIYGQQSGTVGPGTEFSPAFEIKIPADRRGAGNWLRLSATVRLVGKEYETWAMQQLVVRFTGAGGAMVKYTAIRVPRLLEEGATSSVFFDVKIPDGTFEKCETYFWNVTSQKKILFDDLRAEAFR